MLPSSGSPAASVAATGRGPLARDGISSETTLAPLRARDAAGVHSACAVKHGFQCRAPALALALGPHRRGSGFAQRLPRPRWWDRELQPGAGPSLKWPVDLCGRVRLLCSQPTPRGRGSPGAAGLRSRGLSPAFPAVLCAAQLAVRMGSSLGVCPTSGGRRRMNWSEPFFRDLIPHC